MRNEKSVPDYMLTIDQAAKRLSMGRSTIYRLIYNGELLSEKINGRMYIPQVYCDEYKVSRKDKRKGKNRNHIHVKTSIVGLTQEEVLAVAIIQVAIEEYKDYASRGLYGICREIEAFFRSQWFGTISLGAIDPEVLIESLKRQSYYGKTLWVKSKFCPGCGAELRSEENED